jgi:riboflavin kinase / FMN adenylyltransferase
MRVLSWDYFLTGDSIPGKRAGAALGVFDGVHSGHRVLLESILRAPEVEIPCAVSFYRNPKAVLRPERHDGDLFTLSQKLEQLEAIGMEVCILIDFSENFSKLPGKDFLALLLGGADFSLIAVGNDFRCGYRLDTDSASIESFASERGVRTERIQALHYRGHVVSSSRIRKDVSDGRLDLAHEMLGRPYELDLRGLPSRREGEIIGFGRERISQVIPPIGNYERELVAGNTTARAKIFVDEAAIKVKGPFEGPPERARFLRSTQRDKE